MNRRNILQVATEVLAARPPIPASTNLANDLPGHSETVPPHSGVRPDLMAGY